MTTLTIAAAIQLLNAKELAIWPSLHEDDRGIQAFYNKENRYDEDDGKLFRNFSTYNDLVAFLLEVSEEGEETLNTDALTVEQFKSILKTAEVSEHSEYTRIGLEKGDTAGEFRRQREDYEYGFAEHTLTVKCTVIKKALLITATQQAYRSGDESFNVEDCDGQAKYTTNFNVLDEDGDELYDEEFGELLVECLGEAVTLFDYCAVFEPEEEQAA